MEADEDVIRRVLGGDQRAYELLVDRYQDVVARFIWNIVPSHHDREEVCQDIFVKVYFKLADFRFDSKFTTWLYQVAYRTAISFSRRKKVPTSDLDDLELAEDWKPDVENQELQQLLDGLMKQLKLEERTVISLFYQQELGVDDIALVVDRPAGTVKSILFRVRQKLQDTIERQMPDLREAI